MSKSSATDQDQDRASRDRLQEQATAVCLSVMTALGRPADFFRISAVRVWEDRYRVNVQTGADPASVRVAHSFFVTVDERGKVIESNPQITRLY